MGVRSIAVELWKRCVSLAGTSNTHRETGVTASNSTGPFQAERPSGSEDDGRKLTLLVYGQSLWMAVTLTLLFVLGLWSLRLYFVVSFIGLLINRLLFAPTRRSQRWWRVVSALTWLCFLGLSYLISLRMQAAVA
ncbi:hypothetical protein [Haloarcula salinisoli]|uniref:Uncharacterized protein n=1 Tax=Haloarcula salinisoli TaxID=2487746 RepID=A0A8J7YHN6_9EURY|nr:hypothetical protein [Halomicroarcula salinisoli]MBX0285627.1 hypothetical protein [Halomicroarcula salinisoli]MBX0302884.1 hypothetical protein [Halomicroarcula salinisoli]